MTTITDRRNIFVVGCAATVTAVSGCCLTAKKVCEEHFDTWNARVQKSAHEVLRKIKSMNPTKQTDLSAWHLAEQTISSKGQKSCQLTADHERVSFNLGANLRTRFGASSFDKSVDLPRKNLDFDITGQSDLREFLQMVDDWTVDYIFDHGARLFKKVMSKDVVREHYRPLLSMYGDTASVRTKVNVRGHRVCQCWDKDRNATELPEDWLSNTYDVQVSLPQLYIMGNDFGWVMETTALRVCPIENECPF